jgi:flagellar hook-associated protein 3 FlgL
LSNFFQKVWKIFSNVWKGVFKMRVTNHHVFGTSMNNIWRNARHLNTLVTQEETGKRIQKPSDDPLLSSRALRFRTILAEAEQFLRNVEQGMAWMEVSEAAFNNVLTGSPTHPSLMQRMYTRIVEGAQTGTNTLEDQRAILSELLQYFEQMFQVDMNQTYLGRYVFSGFHTDQPPVLKQDQPGRSFIVSQFFNTQDIERTLTFHRPTLTSMPEDIWINVLKLPYTSVDFDFITTGIDGNLPTIGIFAPDGTPFTIANRISTDADAYRPPDDGLTIHHIVDTGELVFGDAIAAAFADGTRVTYEIRDLVAGELNPIIYFNSHEIFTDDIPHISRAFNTEGQNIQMEISPMAYITTNSHARNILTANLFSDFRRMFDFADTLQLSDPSVIEDYFRNVHMHTGDDLVSAVDRFLSDENAMFASMMHNRMNNMLELIMRHAAQAQREHSNLGSRMARLEMVGIRLEEDEVAYTELLSENEDVDLIETMKRRNASEAAFGHALMAIARTTQLTLADFINR